MSDWNEIDNPYDDALNNLPEGLRNALPKMDIVYQGKETVIKNFEKIINQLKREANDLKRYFTKELGTRAKIKGKQLIFMNKFPKSLIESTLSEYIKKFIICPNCGKPDTILKGKKKNLELICAACGYTTKLKMKN